MNLILTVGFVTFLLLAITEANHGKPNHGSSGDVQVFGHAHARVHDRHDNRHRKHGTTTRLIIINEGDSYSSNSASSRSSSSSSSSSSSWSSSDEHKAKASAKVKETVHKSAHASKKNTVKFDKHKVKKTKVENTDHADAHAKTYTKITLVDARKHKTNRNKNDLEKREEEELHAEKKYKQEHAQDESARAIVNRQNEDKHEDGLKTITIHQSFEAAGSTTNCRRNLTSYEPYCECDIVDCSCECKCPFDPHLPDCEDLYEDSLPGLSTTFEQSWPVIY